MWKAPLFWHPGICVYFRSEIFWGCLFSLYSMTWLWYLSSTSNKWEYKIKGQYMNMSTFLTIKYMKGSIFFKGQVYEWDRFRNSGSHTCTTITHKLRPYTPSPQILAVRDRPWFCKRSPWQTVDVNLRCILAASEYEEVSFPPFRHVWTLPWKQFNRTYTSSKYNKLYSNN